MLGWLAMLVGNKIANDARSNRLSQEYVKENGLDHPEWNKDLQMRLWRKWLNAANDTIMTQMEQYQSAIVELESQGYKWNSAWDPFTPKVGSYLTASLEKSVIANKEETARKANYMRQGENMQLQYEILKYYFWGNKLITKDNFSWSCYHKTNGGSSGRELHAPYTYKIRLVDENNKEDMVEIPLQEALDIIIPPEALVDKTEKQIEEVLKNVFSRSYNIGKTKSVFDPPRIFFLGDFMWYEDIVHYPFSDTFIPHPSSKKMEDMGQSEHRFSILCKDRQCNFEKNIEVYFYRNLPDNQKWYIKKLRLSSEPKYINVQCSK